MIELGYTAHLYYPATGLFTNDGLVPACHYPRVSAVGPAWWLARLRSASDLAGCLRDAGMVSGTGGGGSGGASDGAGGTGGAFGDVWQI